LLAAIAGFGLYLGWARSQFFGFMDARDRQQRAAAANDRALEFSNRREFTAAARLLEQAHRDVPGDSVITGNLAFAYGNRCLQDMSHGRYQDARADIARALALRDRDAVLWFVKAEVCDRMGQADSSRSALARAEKLGGMTTAVQQRLARLKRDLAVQSSFQSGASGHFDIRFEGAENRDFADAVLTLLENARDRVGRDLGWRVDRATTVILYSDRQFADVTRLPAWTGAAFDGTIRVPAAGYREDKAVLATVLAHEFTHALLFDICGNRCPVWFSEGLAQLEEGRSPEPGYAPLSGLTGPFTAMNGEQAQQAYRASLSAVAFLAREHDMGFIRILLEKMRSGQDFAAAFAETYNESLTDFEERWKQSVAQ
jgi:tetratricopeptide (TPR) repeat protein